MKALGTDRERQFFLSQDDYYKKVRTRTGPVPCVSHAARRLTRPGLRSSRAWLRLCYCQMAIEFAAQGICTEVFLPAKAYVDVATLGTRWSPSLQRRRSAAD